MRKILFTEHDYKRPDQVGYFHQWGYYSNELGTHSIAIIEDEEGNVYQILPYKIKFIEPPTK